MQEFLQAIESLLETGDVSLIQPYLSTFMQHKITQEIFVWGIIYKFFIKRDVKKGFSETEAKWGAKVEGVETAIVNLTATIKKVEEIHFSNSIATNDRVDRQGLDIKDIKNRQTALDNMISRMRVRLKWSEHAIQLKLGATPPEPEVEHETTKGE